MARPWARSRLAKSWHTWPGRSAARAAAGPTWRRVAASIRPRWIRRCKAWQAGWRKRCIRPAVVLAWGNRPGVHTVPEVTPVSLRGLGPFIYSRGAFDRPRPGLWRVMEEPERRDASASVRDRPVLPRFAIRRGTRVAVFGSNGSE